MLSEADESNCRHLINNRQKVQFGSLPERLSMPLCTWLIVASNCNGSNETCVTNCRNLVSLNISLP